MPPCRATPCGRGRHNLAPKFGLGALREVLPAVALLALCVEYDAPITDVACRWRESKQVSWKTPEAKGGWKAGNGITNLGVVSIIRDCAVMPAALSGKYLGNFTVEPCWRLSGCVMLCPRGWIINEGMPACQVGGKVPPQGGAFLDELLEISPSHRWEHLQKRLVDLSELARCLVVHCPLALLRSLHVFKSIVLVDEMRLLSAFLACSRCAGGGLIFFETLPELCAWPIFEPQRGRQMAEITCVSAFCDLGACSSRLSPRPLLPQSLAGFLSGRLTASWVSRLETGSSGRPGHGHSGAGCPGRGA